MLALGPDDYRELAPGVVVIGGQAALCPGCWAEATGNPVPRGEALLRWFKDAKRTVRINGFRTEPSMSAKEFAAHYTKEPWHDS